MRDESVWKAFVCWCWSFLYIAILRSPADSALLSHVILYEWLAFYRAFWILNEVAYLQRCFVVTWLVPRKTAAGSAGSVYTINHAPCTVTSCTMYRRFMHHVPSLHVPCTVTSCTMYRRFEYHVLSLHVPCTIASCTVHRRFMYHVPSLHVPSTVASCKATYVRCKRV